jgi:phosphatidylserine/phosphatidylglycerophosphate/cardiolipin synthase-like enzyme
MSLSSDLARYFEALESASGLPALYGEDALVRLQKSPDFQSFNARLEKLAPEQRLLVVLRSLASQKTTLSPDLLDADLVVTFPGSESISARHTLHVVRQMISGAANEILIAGYAITDAGGVLSQLATAARRGIRILLVCSDWMDKRNGKTAAMLTGEQWPSDAPKPRIHEYRNDSPDTAGMHIKCLLVDGVDMLIGSANFTYPGLNTNFEMGVRLNGIVAKSARSVFDEFLRTGNFREISLRGT